MKKALSLILSVILVLTALLPCFSVFAEIKDADETRGLVSSLGETYKFTFGKDGDQFDYNAIINQTDEYKGLTYYPVWTYTDESAKTPAFQYKTMYDENGENGVDVLNIKGPSNFYFTPLTKDGTPFEAEPGKQYKVTIKAYGEVETSYSQLYISLGGNTVRTNRWYDDDYNNTTTPMTLYGSRGATNVDSITYNSTTKGSQPNRNITTNGFTRNSGNAWAQGVYGTTTTAAYRVNSTAYLAVPENSQCVLNEDVAVYDTEKDLYTFNLPLVTRKDLTAPMDDNKDGKQDIQVNHNFLTLFVSGSTFTDADGVVHPFSYNLESLEITELGNTVPGEILDADTIDGLYSSLGDSYKFTFGEDGDRYNYNSVLNNSVIYKGQDYFPFWSYTDGKGNANISYKTMYDANGKNGVDVLNVQTSESIYLTLLDKNGKPFEVLPGKQYKVILKSYSEVDTNYSNLYISLGGNTKRTNKWYDNDWDNAAANMSLYGSRGASSLKNIKYATETYATQPNRNITQSGFTPNNGGTYSSGVHGSFIGSARAATYTTYYSVPANIQCVEEEPVAVYDEDNDRINYNIPLVPKNNLSGAVDSNKDGVQDIQINHNYLTLFFSASTYTDADGVVHPFSYSIESVEIIEIGDSVANKALKATATASSSEENAALLNDNKNTDTSVWTSDFNDSTPYVQLDWKEITKFDSVRMFEYSNNSYNVGKYTIEVSKDGENFEKVYEGNKIGACFEASFSRSVWAKSVRVKFEDKNVSLKEIEIYDNNTSAQSRNYSMSATLSASSNRSDFPVANIADGIKTGDKSRYVPLDNATLPVWVQLEWDAPINFDTVNIYEWLDGNKDYRADEIVVEYSPDGNTWNTLYEGVGIGEKLAIEKEEPITAKKLRLTMKSLVDGMPASYLPCIREIEVYNKGINANILTFSSDSLGNINEETSEIKLEVVPGTTLTSIEPIITTEKGVTVSPMGAQDFTNPVIYTITSPNGKISRKYTVTVKVKDFYNDTDLKDNGSQDVAAFGPTPSPHQYKYQKEEMAAFLHFGMKTFTDQEIAFSKNDISCFDLTEKCDTDGYVKTLKEAGFDMVIYTARHHDGLAMWDTATTDYKITNTVYGGDFLAELSASCNKYDLDMGLYLQPWDVATEYYGYRDAQGNFTTKENDVLDYNDWYANQLIELLSNPKYGHNGVFREIWLDGANPGGVEQEYDSQRWINIMKEYEGDDVLLFGCGKDSSVRWIYNESGIANDTNWSKASATYGADGSITSLYVGENVTYKGATTAPGLAQGNKWIVPEADTVLTSGWFWGPSKNTPKTLETLREIYLDSVGHNAVLLLNVPLNTSGTLDPAIKERIVEFGNNVTESFERGNMLEGEGVEVTASSVLNNDVKFKPSNVFDGNDNTYWTAAEGEKEASLHINFNKEVTFDTIILEEAIQFGQRVESFKVMYKNASGTWSEFTSGTTIGAKRVALENAVTTTELIITVIGQNAYNSVGTPVISYVGVHKATSAFEKSTGAPVGIETIDNSDAAFTTTGCEVVNDKDCISNSYVVANAGNKITIKFNGTKAWLIGNTVLKEGRTRITIDGKDVNTIDFVYQQGGAKAYIQQIFETKDLTDGEHTMVIEVLTGQLEIDALFVLNNGGKGYLEFENSTYTMEEDMDYQIKVVRKGGSKGKIKAIIQDLPGSAVQTSYYTTDGLVIEFEDGETEKTFTFRTMRYYTKTGTLSMKLEIMNPDESDTDFALGFNASTMVNIIDAESYDAPYLRDMKLTKAPVKLTYSVCEELDLGGMVITGTFANGESRVFYNDQYTVSNVDMSTVGTKTVTVTSAYDNKTVTFDITVGEDITYQKGDINGDNVINAADLALLKKIIAGFVSADDEEVKNIVVDDNLGVPNASDLALLKKMIAGLA